MRKRKDDDDFVPEQSKKSDSKKKDQPKGNKGSNSNDLPPARSVNAKFEEGLTWIEAAEEAINELAKKDKRDPREGWHYKNEILKKIFQLGHVSTSGKTPEGTLNRCMRGRTGRAIFVAVSGKPAHYTLRKFQLKATDDAFSLITDTSKFDFAHPFPLTRKMLQDFQQKVNKLGNNALCAHLSKLLSEGVRRTRAREHESIVFLGGMSQGKSFLIDSILRLTTIPKYSPEVLKVPWEERLQHMLGDVAELCGSRQGMFQTIFDELMSKRHQQIKTFSDLDGDLTMDELKKGQKLARDIIENVVNVFPVGKKKDQLHAGCFLLESCPKANKSTTPFPIFVRFGWVPAIVVRFFSDVSEVPYDDQKFSNLAECLQSFNLNIVHVTSQINKKMMMFVGNGYDLEEDRLYIREKLKLISHNPLLEFVTSEVIVYMPTPILQNNAQLVDCPGYLDAKTTRKKHTQRTVESAKIVWFILNKNLEHCETELNMLPRFINKMADDSVEHGLVLSWMFEKDKQYNKEEFMDAFDLNKKTVAENKAFLDQWLNDLLQKDADLESTKAMMGFVKKSIAVLPIYPLLFSSLVLNSQKKGFQDKEANDKILQQTGGYHIFGVLFQFFFGKSIRMMEHLDTCILEPFEQLLEIQPKSNVIEKSVTVDLTPLKAIFSTLLKSSPSSRAKGETTENTMELLSDISSSVEEFFEKNAKALEPEDEDFQQIFQKSLLMKLNDLINMACEKKSHLKLATVVKEVASSIKMFSTQAEDKNMTPVLVKLAEEVETMRQSLKEKREYWAKDSVHYKEPNAIGKSLLGANSLLFLPQDIQRETLLICTETCLFQQEIPNSDSMICCDGCNVWYHMPCVDVKEEDMKKEKWYCSRECRDEVEFQKPIVSVQMDEDEQDSMEIPIYVSP